MKKLILLAAALISSHAFAEGAIKAEQAASYVGKQKIVCGVVAQTITKKGYTYVNFGKKYPNQVFHLFITEPKNYSNLANLTNKNVCAFGKIETYKGKPEITNPKSIEIK